MQLTKTQPAGTDLAGAIDGGGAFCTTAGVEVMGFLAGPSVAHVWARNTHAGQSCGFTLNMRNVGPSGSTLVGSRNASIPNRTDTPTRFDISIPHAAFLVGATSRLRLDVTGANGAGCSNTTIHAGSSAYVSSIDLPGAGAPPNPPTGLSAVRQSDGSVVLSWTAPASGSTVAYYRIYRDGRDVTHRIDRTGSATPTSYTDPKPPANSTYYVTSVTATLGESSTLGPVTG